MKIVLATALIAMFQMGAAHAEYVIPYGKWRCDAYGKQVEGATTTANVYVTLNGEDLKATHDAVYNACAAKSDVECEVHCVGAGIK